MANTYSAGIVTAYGAAKKAGYTGTYEEFCAEQASFAQNAQQVRQDKESVEQTVETFSETTVPAAVQSVTDEGTAQVGRVTNAGTTAVGNVNDAGTTQVGNVNSAGQTQVGNVNDAGSTQVENVQNEGNTQIQAVEDKGAEVLETIPADYTELSDTVFNDVTGLDTKAPVILETASGAIASFNDGADGMPIKKLVAQIEPVQDLHGYSNPWPAGGGKNKLNNTATTTTSNGVTFTVNADGSVSCSGTATGTAVLRIYTDFTIAENVILSGCPSGGNYNTGYSLLAANQNGSAVSGEPTTSADFGYGVTIQSQYVASIKQIQIIVRTGTNMDGKVFYPMIRLATETDATFAPYENLCPISGWTGAEVQTAGINLFDKSKVQSGYFSPDLSEAGGSTSNRYRSDYIKVTPGAPYYFDHNVPSSATMRGVWYDRYKTPIRGIAFMPSTATSGTDTAPENAAYLRAVCYKTDVDAFMISSGSTATDYEPYTGNQISVTFPDEAGDSGTVYGATMILNPDRTGTLVVDKLEAKLSELAYTKTPSGLFQTNSLISVIHKPNSSTMIPTNFIMSSLYEEIGASPISGPKSATPSPDGVMALNPVGTLYFNYLAVDTVDDFVSDMQSLDAQLVYELASPRTYNLTAEQVSGILSTLYGQNNIWADTGDVTVEYPADTKIYIDNKITQAIANALNS